MKKTEFSFSRLEKKYILTEEQYLGLMIKLKESLIPDEYPKYTLRNIYYDTPDDFLIRTSIEKPKYKEKLRMRSYGSPSADSKVFIEIKRKCLGIVGKRRISLPYADAVNYLEGGIPPEDGGQIFNEIDFFVKRRPLIPKQYISYEREAFTYKGDTAFRITFDRNIIGRRYDLRLDGDNSGDILFADGSRLLEIKVPGAFPHEIARILSELEIYPTAFSKYGTFYKAHIKKQSEVTQCLKASSQKAQKEDSSQNPFSSLPQPQLR